MRRWTKEDKTTLDWVIADVETCYCAKLNSLDAENMAMDGDDDVERFKQELAFLDELSKAMVADVNASAEPIRVELGQRYRCLYEIDYESSKLSMFTKGNVYVVIKDKCGRVGLMSNDGVVRTERDIPGELNTEYFKLEED